MNIRDDFVDAVGNTPLIKLRKASELTGCTILGKAEFLNPGGSVKDRAAKYMVLDAEKRGVKVLGISVDGVEDHKKWKGDIEKFGGAKASFPIVADEGLEMSKAFDMLPADAYLPDGRTPADSATVRSVFIVAPNKKVQLMMTYPMSVGRNFAEVLRALDGLQTSTGKGVATPANWNVGDDVIIPATLSDDDAKAKFGDFNKILPYLRTTKAPS